ncbi:MAG: hypothetical protein JNK82_29725 [Myxococcaceae bacterium]|nr:hypothetical protein [Myxococcaceae bacterium]
MIALASIALVALTVEPAYPPSVAERLFKGEERLDPAEHAGKLYGFIVGTDPTHPMFGRAQLYLAQSLQRLGYTQAAAVWYARLATERSDPEALPEALAGLLQIFEGAHDEVLEQQVLGVLDVGSLPKSVAARVRLTQGLIDLKAGRDAWAKTQFGLLPPGSPEAALARHAVLVTRVKRGESAAKLLPPFKALATDASAPAPVRLEAQLAVARLTYESKEFDGALEAYRAVKLPELDPGRPALYLEEAWTKYRLSQNQAAMAVLVTLDAPSFEDAFLPDKYLLKAQIYMEKCHYLPARRAARQLLRRFAGTLDAIEARAPLAEQAVLSKAALAKGPAQKAQGLFERVQAERDQLARDGAGLGKALNEHLKAVYGTAYAEAARSRDARLDHALEVEANRLLDAAEQVRLVEYEVGLKLNARAAAHEGELVPESQDAYGPEDVSYNFSGEYWNDELRDIRIDLEDRCREGNKT